MPKTQRTVVNGAKAGREVVPGDSHTHTLPQTANIQRTCVTTHQNQGWIKNSCEICRKEAGASSEYISSCVMLGRRTKSSFDKDEKQTKQTRSILSSSYNILSTQRRVVNTIIGAQCSGAGNSEVPWRTAPGAQQTPSGVLL